MRHPIRITVALALLLALGAPSVFAADGSRPAAVKKKPVATKKASKPQATAPKAKKRTSKAAAKKTAPATKAARAKKKGPAPTARAAKPPVTTQAIATPAPAKPLPPPRTATFIPLGPERFYPNGIPELRPEFMHPLPDPQMAARQEAAKPDATFEERRSWFAAPQ